MHSPQQLLKSAYLTKDIPPTISQCQNPDELQWFTVNELKVFLRANNQKKDGLKKDLVARVWNFLKDPPKGVKIVDPSGPQFLPHCEPLHAEDVHFVIVSLLPTKVQTKRGERVVILDPTHLETMYGPTFWTLLRP